MRAIVYFTKQSLSWTFCSYRVLILNISFMIYAWINILSIFYILYMYQCYIYRFDIYRYLQYIYMTPVWTEAVRFLGQMFVWSLSPGLLERRKSYCYNIPLYAVVPSLSCLQDFSPSSVDRNTSHVVGDIYHIWLQCSVVHILLTMAISLFAPKCWRTEKKRN